MAQPAPLPNGHQLGEYLIDSVLGVGGFGLTYLATDTNLDQQVAIKEYLPGELATRDAALAVHANANSEDIATFDWGLKRFLAEARILASFRHPNIVRVMRFFQANNTAYMVMEFVRGASLPEWIKPKRPINDILLLQIAAPLCEGLGVIHAAGFIHRDVKPANIYIREDGSPVLLDFGAARANANAEMTAVVSPGYAPVEQYSESSAQGPYTDLYALGGVMYWMATATKPVDATARLKNDPQIRARDAAAAAHLPMALREAIDWAMQPDETARPQTAAAFLRRLRPHDGSLGDPAVRTTAFNAALYQSPPVQSTKPSDATRTLPSATVSAVVSPSTAAQDISSRLSAAQLAEVEAELAQTIGPLAGVLVKRAAKRNTDFDKFLADLAGEIEDEGDRANFTTRVRGNTKPPAAMEQNTQSLSRATYVADPTAPPAVFSPDVIARAERRLSQHIGAVAVLVVKKAARRARDESELYLMLADQIDNEEDRKAFIKKAIRAAG
jgi:serine/threonine protein kinase